MWTAPSASPGQPQPISSVRSSFGITAPSPSTGSLRIATADRRAQPLGTSLPAACLQRVSLGEQKRKTNCTIKINHDTDMAPNRGRNAWVESYKNKR